MTKKNTKTTAKKNPKPVHSYGLLEFPQDVHGVTHRLRAEMQKIGANISGDKARLDLVGETLEVLMDYLAARASEAPVQRLKSLADIAKEEAEAKASKKADK